MLTIGLTGGIASGKSTVSSILRELGARVADADLFAHQVMAQGTDAFREIRQVFPSAFDAEGHLNRHQLADLVFSDESQRMRLNAIVHPKVRALMAEAVAEAQRGQERAIVLDIPLLIENALQETVDEVWLVYVSPDVQLKRLMERNDFSEKEALLRMRAQMPLDQKRRFATVVIDNNGTLEALRQTVNQLWLDRVGRI